MSLGDKISNKAEGQADQASAGLKNVVEDVKDAVGEGVEKIKNVFSK